MGNSHFELSYPILPTLAKEAGLDCYVAKRVFPFQIPYYFLSWFVLTDELEECCTLCVKQIYLLILHKIFPNFEELTENKWQNFLARHRSYSNIKP
uniref:Uncharacterized protein n=1 Tax=Anguilla anguilla TaxID=7936 RepID=A0A0E9WHE7_ANGAN